MILRAAGAGVMAIGQASHAWLSGQLARAWGNGRFPAPAPLEEVVLGAVQHDVGMALWDLAPERHPTTGLPVQFFELDRPTHLALWSAAPKRVLTQSRYAALLVSLHGTGLYERFPPRTDDPEIARAVAAYRDEQRVLQARLARELGAEAAELRRNQALLAAWDDLSLALCRGQETAHEVHGVPGAGDAAETLSLLARPGDPDADEVDATLDPWPFSAPSLTVRVEGRVLAGPSPDAAALHAALDAAPLRVLRFVLRPRALSRPCRSSAIG
jgi:hypothetical protein